MMKKTGIFLAALLSVLGFSQDYKTRIAKTTCECFTQAKAGNPDAKTLEIKLGLCIIQGAQPYAEELKKDYNLDILRDDSSETGKLVATWLMKECPDTFIEVFKLGENDKNKESRHSELLISGTVIKIEKNNFVVFHMAGDNRILNKLYWVFPVESNLDLPKEYSALLHKKVNVSYYPGEIFDAGINDYRKVNIISVLKTD
ncbi:hypothetical protein [Chryseobacterium gregarium]|uniref:hypothetical protein n=1 Tax=Chryseobacterium gregarium TaxID=456299 RepID=UPI000407533E|nr:hypothetical protein [Chryseobacterium gregarium]